MRRQPNRPGLDRPPGVAHEVAAIRAEIERFLDYTDPDTGNKPSNAKCGVYVFYDYDAEPIYVGQTYEKIRTRIRRHLTNQRTDAVAMNVLDPFEVAEIEVYPFYDLERAQPNESRPNYEARMKATLAAAEYTIYQHVLKASALGAVLNEGDIAPREPIELPAAHRGRIIPDSIYDQRKHPDVRIARRANTIAALTRVISERDVSKGLRRTLLTQARRLERLASQRLAEIGGGYPVEQPGSETGEDENPS